ncbi:MAG: DUF4112 domain-containing protein [Planctomycetota bacterium]
MDLNPSDHATQLERLKRVRRLARLMDASFRIPLTSIRFGADSLIGLLPGVGDAVSSVISLVIIWEALQARVPFHVLLRMVFNVVLDFLGGSIPIVGDIFDVLYRANMRNAALIEEHAALTDDQLARELPLLSSPGMEATATDIE